MNNQQFENFLRNEVLPGVINATITKNTAQYAVILRFSNDRHWLNANTSIEMQDGNELSPFAVVSFDIDGSVIGGIGDNGIRGEPVPNIAHYSVSGRFKGRAKIIQDGVRRRLELKKETTSIENYLHSKTSLIPNLDENPFTSVSDGLVVKLDDWIGDKIALRGNQELM